MAISVVFCDVCFLSTLDSLFGDDELVGQLYFGFIVGAFYLALALLLLFQRQMDKNAY
jgi:hypothetical protein